MVLMTGSMMDKNVFSDILELVCVDVKSRLEHSWVGIGVGVGVVSHDLNLGE